MTAPAGTGTWHEPRTLGGTMLLGAALYAVSQPLAQLLFHSMFGDPLPFRGAAQWGGFLAVCVALGALVGAALHAIARRPAGSWPRAWVKSTAAMLWIGVSNSAVRFADRSLAGWLLQLVIVAAVTGTLFTPFFRWSDRLEARTAAARGTGT